MPAEADATQLLLDATAGAGAALDLLFPQVYDELRQIAHRQALRGGGGDTLDTTALVHETYLRLIDQSRVDPRDRAHFLAIAARAMRFILIDHVRARAAQKRGGAAAAVPLDAVQLAVEQRTGDLLLLDEALQRLETVSSRLSRVVECRFFGGLSFADIGRLLDSSERTAKRDWQRARAWLHHYMDAREP